MPFELDLPLGLRKEGWKIKIRDKERLEQPHVTVLRKTDCWRYGLRDEVFLDTSPDPGNVPKAIRKLLTGNLNLLRQQWDRLYPENRVGGSL